jgi:DNA-binding NtrC family response regulator
MKTLKRRILVVDDDPTMTGLLADILGASFEVRTANNVIEAVGELKRELPDVLLCDFHLAGDTSESLLWIIARRFPTVRRILMSAAEPDEWMYLVHGRAVEAALRKPFGIEELLGLLDGEPLLPRAMWS